MSLTQIKRNTTLKMKHYSSLAIQQLCKHVYGDTSAFNWLIEHNCRELVATLDAIRDDKHAFKFLIDNKHFELAAFVSAIWEDSKAFKFLIDRKAYDWAACSNIVNGDEKAEKALKAAGKLHFIALANAILRKIQEDGDRNSSPVGVIKNLLDFRKALKE